MNGTGHLGLGTLNNQFFPLRVSRHQDQSTDRVLGKGAAEGSSWRGPAEGDQLKGTWLLSNLPQMILLLPEPKDPGFKGGEGIGESCYHLLSTLSCMNSFICSIPHFVIKYPLLHRILADLFSSGKRSVLVIRRSEVWFPPASLYFFPRRKHWQ